MKFAFRFIKITCLNSNPVFLIIVVLQILISALFGIAASAFAPAYNNDQSNRPQAAYEKNARIIALDSDVREDSFRYNYETENGIKGEEQGQEVSKNKHLSENF